MISIFSNIKCERPLDAHRDDLFTIEDIRDIISLKKKLSSFDDSWSEEIDNWPFIVKKFESMDVHGCDKAEYKELKSKLPSMYFSAKAETSIKPKAYSGFFCIDIDRDDNLFLIDFAFDWLKKNVFEMMPSCQLIFKSPSGKGLKVVHATTFNYVEKTDVKTAFTRIFEHYDREYQKIGITIDPQCKNWNRHCFLSYDRNFFYREAKFEIVDIYPDPMPKEFISTKEATGYKLGRGSKISCPKCHHPNRFRNYVDERDNIILNTGMCDRVNSCGADIKPRDIYPDKKWYFKK